MLKFTAPACVGGSMSWARIGSDGVAKDPAVTFDEIENPGNWCGAVRWRSRRRRTKQCFLFATWRLCVGCLFAVCRGAPECGFPITKLPVVQREPERGL